MATRGSTYTRTERVLLAMQQLLDEPGFISSTELARLTGAPVATCQIDLALVRRFVELEKVEQGSETRWILPGRDASSQDRLAYELAQQGVTWEEIAERLELPSAKSAKSVAKRHAVLERLPWPPVASV